MSIVQLLDIFNFLEGSTSLDSFVKAYRTSETKSYFAYEWFDDPEKINNTPFAPCETLFSRLWIKNTFEADSSEFHSLIFGGLTSQEALSKLKVKQPPGAGQENYQYLTNVWQHEIILTLEDFLCRYKNKDVVPMLKTMQNVVGFYHKKDMTCESLDVLCQIVQIFVFTSQPQQNFIPSQKTTWIY